MKKITTLIVTVFLLLFVVACTPNNSDGKVTVTFDTKGGSPIEPIKVDKNGLIEAPADPDKEGFVFRYWYTTNEDVAFSFDTPITANITLNASWDDEANPTDIATITAMINEDIDAVEEQLYKTYYDLSLLSKGPINNSVISWTSTNKYVSNTGIILPLIDGESEDTTMITGKFVLNGVTINHEFDVDLYQNKDVELEDRRTVPFRNLTEEYDVVDGEIELLYEKGGSVPYVRVEDFMKLLSGFIDPALDITYETNDTSLYIQYDYYDEDEDVTYDLNVTIDTVTNTLVAPDPGFYWGYVYSTATNFGRHITYDRENPNAHYTEGQDVVYDLSKYNMDIVLFEGDVVLPYYMANQLFAGSSYYNVYYNYDGLFGVYSLPSEGEDAYETIRTSTKNSTTLPTDLTIHTFNFLAFSMDYFYGLKELREVETYYDLLFEKRDSFLTRNALRLDLSIHEFLTFVVDEPHTSYGYPGYFNRSTYTGPSVTSLNDFGDRFKKWYLDGMVATDAQIGKKWGEATSGWNASGRDRKLYWFLDEAKTSAVLSLDGFSTADIIEDTAYNNQTVLDILKVESHIFPAINGGNKYFYYNQSNHDNNVVEILIKGLTRNDLQTYNASLVSLGFTASANNQTFTKEVDGLKYYASTSYDDVYKSLIVGLSVFDMTKSVVPEFVNSSDTLIKSDSAVFMEFYMDIILSQTSNLENMILDITWNTGGNVGALYRVIGFITQNSFAVSSISADTKSNSTSYVKIEGVPTYDHLNWALLTTPTSFSAANSLTTIFKENNLGPIIGLTSGGGTSSITPILLPNGTAFTTSSNNMSAYRTGTGTEADPFVYHPNEFGIEPTHPIPIGNIYNETVLLDILTSHFGE